MKKLLRYAQFALPISLVVAFVHINRRGVGDLDSWWHVKIGDQIRAGVPFNDLGKSWSLYAGNWKTSQWLSEVLMSLSHQAFGWRGLLLWRLVFGLALLLVFSYSLARNNGMPAVVVTSVISFFVLVPAIQERPALIGMIFVTVLGANCHQIWLEGQLSKSIWLWIPATALWANLHGSWILAPTAFSLSCLLALSRVRTKRFVKESLALVASVTVAGCLTPIGWQGLFLPFKLHKTAGRFITEWQSTTLVDPLIYGLLALLAILIFLWVTGNQRPTLAELCWVLICTLFAFTAFRNVGPAILFIAPVAAHRMNLWFNKFEVPATMATTKFRTRPFLACLVGALAIALLSTLITDPLKGVTPRFIAQRLSQSTADLRIINDYNTSGVLLALGGERVHLAVDGRADRFDPNWLDRYFSMLKQSRSNQYLLDQLQPNSAVLHLSSPLIWQLIVEKHWRRVMTDRSFVLVVAPEIELRSQ